MSCYERAESASFVLLDIRDCRDTNLCTKDVDFRYHIYMEFSRALETFPLLTHLSYVTKH